MRDLMFTERRTYSDLLHAEEGVSTNILADRLRRLQAAGLIRKDGKGRGARYALTSKGLGLLPAMLELVAWSARHDGDTAAPPALVARIRNDRDALAAEMRTALEAEFSVERGSP